MHIEECTVHHLDAAAALFNHYRMFYQQDDDLPSCRAFIRANVEQRRSRLFLLFDDGGRAVGLCQLYPSFCSLSLQPYYYLSDLYVDPSCRQQGHARFLMNEVSARCAAEGAHRLTLDTARSNTVAQHLYASLGYEEEQVYITYHQMLAAPQALTSA
jgi:ribosomal protein S18 acetylase RimI-like enzyme